MLPILCITLSLYASDISKQNNAITRFNHLFFKKISDNTTLCYAIAQTPAGNKAIKTIIEEPRWHYVETFKNKNAQFIGSLGTDKIIALTKGNVYITINSGNKKIWHTKEPIFKRNNRNFTIIDAIGISKEKLWLTMYNEATKETIVSLMTKNTDSYEYSVKPTDYKAFAITPDSKYAWFIKPLSQDNPALVVSIEELEKKERSATVTHDEDATFEEAPVTIDTMFPLNIKKLVAMNASMAYAIDDSGKLYTLDYQGDVNNIDTKTIGLIDTIAALDNKLIVTSGNTIYRYENKQFMPLLKKDIIETEEAITPEKKPEPSLAPPTTSLKHIEVTPTIESKAATPEASAPESPVTVLPEQTLSLSQPETTETNTPKEPLPQVTPQTKDSPPVQEEIKAAPTIQEASIPPKKNYYDPLIQHRYDPLIEDKPEYVSTEQELLQQIVKPKLKEQIVTPQNSSYWDFVKKSAAAARAQAQGAWQNYGQKASGWFKNWYTQKKE